MASPDVRCTARQTGPVGSKRGPNAVASACARATTVARPPGWPGDEPADAVGPRRKPDTHDRAGALKTRTNATGGAELLHGRCDWGADVSGPDDPVVRQLEGTGAAPAAWDHL